MLPKHIEPSIDAVTCIILLDRTFSIRWLWIASGKCPPPLSLMEQQLGGSNPKGRRSRDGTSEWRSQKIKGECRDNDDACRGPFSQLSCSNGQKQFGELHWRKREWVIDGNMRKERKGKRAVRLRTKSKRRAGHACPCTSASKSKPTNHRLVARQNERLA
jgi:hypothetical protein